MQSAYIKILGCGNSAGVPAVGNYWGACDPEEPKNVRMRPCALVHVAGRNLVIDTGPDFRAQMNCYDVRHIDGVFFTHAHNDHVNGIDDLRVLAHIQKTRIPVYGMSDTLDMLAGRFPSLFVGSPDKLYEPVVRPHSVFKHACGCVQKIAGIPCVPFMQDHGSCVSLGLRVGNVAYSTDMVDLDDQALSTLSGIHTWIVDGAGYQWIENPAHASLEKIYALNRHIKASRVILTHLSFGMDYATLCDLLPKGYEPAWDGMVIALDDLGD